MACLSRVAAAAAIFAGLLVSALAHGGRLHAWPGTPSGSNLVRAPLATCDTWVKPGSKVEELLAADAPAQLSAKGNLTLWAYLYKNCSDSQSVGAEMNVNVLDAAGKPTGVVNKTALVLDGFVQTGACAASGGPKYFFNTTRAKEEPDSAENMIFFEGFALPANGSLRGNAANDGPVLTSGANAVRSFLLYRANATAPFACCDLKLVGGPVPDLSSKGLDCSNTSDTATNAHASGSSAAPAPTKSGAPAAAGVTLGALLGTLLLAAAL